MTSTPVTRADRPSKRGPAASERRITERFPFSAVAELVDVASHVRITARVADISRTGCYLDVINVFGAGTTIQLAIRHANHQFDATATIVYSLPGMGMGVTFTTISPAMTALLEQWISQLKGDIGPPNQLLERNMMVQKDFRVERQVLGRLIGLMIRNKTVSREDGKSLLDELLRDD